MEYCIDYESGNPPDSCSLEMYHPYTENVKKIYEVIFSLRNGQSTIIRATDLYNPVISEHRKPNMEAECTQCMETLNTAARNAADAFNIPLVTIYDEFNGPGHNEDPRRKGYIGSDGIHASEYGQQVIANLLSAVGYDPVIPE
jgi:lysophospholipase L1-like esterase